MKVKEFKDKLSKGLGSAIVFLKRNPEKAHKYYNAILWACCHDTRYDSQCESGRSDYLYEIMCLSNRKEQLENEVFNRLLSAKKYWNTEQLFDLAVIMHEDGNPKAKEVMYKKFKSYLDDIQCIRVHNHYRLVAASAGATSIIAIDKFDGLEFVLDVMGEIMVSTKRKEIFDTDWVIAFAEDEFGEKEVNNFIERKAKENENIRVFFEEYTSHRRSREEYQQNNKKELPDFETISRIVDEYCSDEKMRIGRRNLLRRLGRKADKKVLVKVAKEIENIVDETRQTALLHVFTNTEYPLPVDSLIRLAYSRNKDLVSAAVSALSNIVDGRVHDLALNLIKDREICVDALELLKLNFNNDYDVIINILKKEYELLKDKEVEFDFHSITMAVRDIFENNKSPESLEILLFLYYNTTCSYCRSHIVEVMCENNILPDDIAEECQYDCVEEIRDMAVKYAGKR